MADSSVAITAGTGTNIDTRTQSGGDHRQVVVLGDAAAADVATVNADGALLVLPEGPDDGARTSVSAATSDTSLLAANAARHKFTVFNDSTSATLYLAIGSAAASTTSYTVQLEPKDFYESAFRGAVRGIWSAAVGAARITEET